ncbi:MAG TPA: hypothetical protein VH022_14380 [Candidatus Acidoferrum sp.]|nr:hypothetical protein [Candidatus Acidoferrum sp.]
MSGPTEGNLNSTTPAAPSGKQNCIFQADAAFTDSNTGLPERDISVYPPSAGAALEGAIAIAGDIGGSSTTPKVVGLQGVGLSATSPTNGQILEYDSSSGLWKPATVIGSGGAGAPANDEYIIGAPDLSNLSNSVAMPDVYASPDAQPATAGSLDDEFNGSSLSGSWTWVNQGPASAIVSNSQLSLIAPAHSGDSLRVITQPAPSTPYQVRAKVALTFPSTANFANAGMVFYDSVSGKLIGIHFSTSPVIIGEWNSTTSFNSNPSGTSWPVGAGPWCYLQMEDDGTHLTFWLSTDGVNFVQQYQASRTAFLPSGPNAVGLFSDSNNATWGAILSCQWFRRTL